MSEPLPPDQVVDDLLADRLGASLRVVTVEPVYGATVWRCTLDRAIAGLGESVIVKRGRAAGELRSEGQMMRNEIAALLFLTANDLPFGPRLIAADAARGVAIMEDLGDGPSLEDLLFGQDRQVALDGLVAFGAALGRLHAATAGRAGAFLASRDRSGATPSALEPAGAYGLSFISRWDTLRSTVAAHPDLPQPVDVEADVDAMLRTLAPAEPYLAMTNGDPCPGNTRLTSGTIRFLDFEQATFHHALLDLTALHLPFPACPCWSVLPDEATAPAIHAWRTAFARCHSGALDDDEYLPSVAAACLAWAILRMAPWTRLDAADEPHPVGFTKRAQRLATIDAAVRVARRADTLPVLTGWLAALSAALRERWSDTPLTLTIFPAFAASRPDLRPGKLPPVPDDKGGIRVRARAGG
jgi:hypothetical protein